MCGEVEFVLEHYFGKVRIRSFVCLFGVFVLIVYDDIIYYFVCLFV